MESPSPTPTASSEPIVESPSPTPTASVKPIVESPSSTPTASSTPVQSPMVISDSLIPIVDDENLDGKIVSVKINKNNAPVIKWQKNSYATGYQIYRSRKKASGYLLIKEINSQQSFQFVDKKTSGNKKYYYRVRCFQDKGIQRTLGEFSEPVSVKTYNLKRPKIRVRRRITANRIPYVELSLKKYAGTKVQVYYRIGKGKYRKLKLKSNSIRKNRRRFNIRCAKKKRIYYFKVRTILRKKKKSYYSKYSNIVKVRG